MSEENSIVYKVLSSGQIARYKDSVYKYEITTDLSEAVVKRFCLNFLYTCNKNNTGSQFNGSCSFPYGLSPFYRFTKVGENKYVYTVCRPYTG